MLSLDSVKTYFGATLNDNQAFIEHIYLNTLDKTYTDDPVGIDFWTDQLDNGQNKGQVVAALINAGAAQTQFNNRVDVSNYVSDHIFAFSNSSTFSAFINTVTDNPSSMTTAIDTIDEIAASQNTINPYSITLTTGKDAIAGSIGADQILGLENTYNSIDSIDGNIGIDTLSLLLFEAETDAVTVSNVEHIRVSNAHAATDVDAQNWTSVDVLTFSHCTTTTSVSNIKEQLTIALDENNQAVEVTYADDALGGVSSSQTLFVTDSIADVDIQTGKTDQIISLNITASGSNLICLAENDLVSLILTGAGDLELVSAAEDNDHLTQISLISASSATGDLILDLSEVDLSFSGDYFVGVSSGAGDDTITASAHDNQIDAGPGDDDVIIESGFDTREWALMSCQ